jgi:hypothetical protein
MRGEPAIMSNKTEKNLKLTCSHCFSTYQLREIHEKESHPCSVNCLKAWQQILHDHYQGQIILYLAQEEANQENHD